MVKRLLLAIPAAALLLCAATVSFPDPSIDAGHTAIKGKQTAVLAGGCFWCTAAVFESLTGVDKVVAGFAGGDAKNADYQLVSAGRTNHAESIEIFFDPARISYGTLLKVFFEVAHDPTQKDRQGPDHGHQYRSAIFYNNAEQQRIAEAYIKQLNDAHVFKKPIVTEISELKGFYPADEYHQQYVKRNPNDPYVVVNSIPKLDKLNRQCPRLLKK